MAGVQGDLSMPPEPQPVQQAALGQAAGAAAGLAPSDPLQPDFSAGTALIKGMGDPMAQANTMIQQRRTALAPLEGDVNQAAGRLKQATALNANAPQQQAAPSPQQGMGLEAAGAWVAAASVLGALAGAMTRRSATNALAAFTGALEGVQSGNKQAFEQNKVIWEQENKRINQQLQQDSERRRAIMEDAKTDLETKLLLYQQEAARQRDDIGIQLAARKDTMAIAQRDDAIERARISGIESFQKMDTTLKAAAIRAGGQGQISDEAVQRAAGQLAQGIPETQVMRGMSRQDIARVRNAQTQSGEESARQKQDFAGDMAGARSVGVRAENLKLAIRTADAAIPQALNASDQVWRTGFVPINQLIQMSQKAGSSPELKAFVGSNIQLAEAWARAMKPTGALDVQLQTRALEYLNTADGPQAYKAAVKTIEQAIRREYGAVQAEQRHEPLPISELPASAAGGAGPSTAPSGTTQSGIKWSVQ